MAVPISKAFACNVSLGKILREDEAFQMIDSSGGEIVKVEFGKKFGRPKLTYKFSDGSKLGFFPSTHLFDFEYRYILPTS